MVHSDHSPRHHCPLTKIKYLKPNKTKYPKDQSKISKLNERVRESKGERERAKYQSSGSSLGPGVKHSGHHSPGANRSRNEIQEGREPIGGRGDGVDVETQ